MTKDLPLVVDFKQVDRHDISLVGGKGSNLGEMIQNNFPIPPGFIVTSQAYYQLLEVNNLKPKIRQHLSNLDIHQPQSLNSISKKIKQLIATAPVPEEIGKTIIKAYLKLGKGKNNTLVAVRSSAAVKGEANLVQKVRACWASLFEPRAIFYRQEKGFNHFKVGIAVPVQKMIQSKVAGIMFTVNPVTNDKNQIVIKAIWGLGEKIVQGIYTPDHYLVQKQTFKILQKQVNAQTGQMTLVKGKNKEIKVKKRQIDKPKLTDEQIIKLAKIGQKIQQYYFFPQDIEWALEKNTLYIIQSRPVATINLSKNKKKKTNFIPTATKIYVNLGEPDLAEITAQKNVDGIGLLRAEFMIAQMGVHPKKLIHDKKQDKFISMLSEGLNKFAKSFYPRPVVYRTTDFKTNQYANLIGGQNYEPKEPNPILGYRGAYRYLKDRQVFDLELKAIKKVRLDPQARNLWLMIPFVRTVNQLKEVKKIVSEHNLIRSPSFKLWMMIEIPSNIVLLKDYAKVGIDGISIGSNDLTMLMLGTDRDNSEVAPIYDERDPAILWALKKAITTAKKLKLTSSICGQAPSVYPDLTQKLIKWGITSVSVSPDMIDQTRQIVHQSEERLIKHAKNN